MRIADFLAAQQLRAMERVKIFRGGAPRIATRLGPLFSFCLFLFHLFPLELLVGVVDGAGIIRVIRAFRIESQAERF